MAVKAQKPSKGWDADLKRIATYLELGDHYTNNTVRFINTYLIIREKQPKEIAKLINDFIADRSGFIVVGDFNVSEDSSPTTNSIKPINSKYCISETERSMTNIHRILFEELTPIIYSSRTPFSSKLSDY